MRNPKVPNHEILSAQYLTIMKKVSFFSRPMAKVSRQVPLEYSPVYAINSAMSFLIILYSKDSQKAKL